MADAWVYIEVEVVKKITDRAILVTVDDIDVWIPKSQIAPTDVDQYEEGDADVGMSITEWIAEQKDLA